jgi:hypothetical protein
MISINAPANSPGARSIGRPIPNGRRAGIAPHDVVQSPTMGAPGLNPFVRLFRKIAGRGSPELTAAIEKHAQHEEELKLRGARLRAEVEHAAIAAGDQRRP